MSKETQDDPRDRQLPPVDLSSLNVKQRLAYDITVHHQTQLMANQQPTPLYMLVCGTAGTGKSYLISAIAHALGDACLLTGITGMASFNICGKTLHSALKLPILHSNTCRLAECCTPETPGDAEGCVLATECGHG